MRPWQSSALNIALMQTGWFACVLGAARGLPWAGPLAVTVLAALHLRLLSRQPRREGLLIAGAAGFGFLLETALSAAGAVLPVAGLLPRPLSPFWMTALWANFATLMGHSMRWLRGRPALAAALGAAGAPPAYVAGEKLGAATISEPYGVFMIAAAWALALPLLAAGAARLLEDPRKSKSG